MAKKTGPILFQLPPNWHSNKERLKNFIKLLLEKDKNKKYVFEFRDPTWFNEKVKSILERFSIGFCINDMLKICPEWVTSDLVYIRFHGPEGEYKGNYTKSTLKKWARKIKKWESKGKEVFVYFNNDIKGYALDNGKKLKTFIKNNI